MFVSFRRLCWKMNTILKCVIFPLFVFGFIPVSTKSFHNCCQSFWNELKKKSEASLVLCSPRNKTYVPFPFGKDYCKSLKTDLQERWDAYTKLCPAIRNKECKYITRRSIANLLEWFHLVFWVRAPPSQKNELVRKNELVLNSRQILRYNCMSMQMLLH